MPSSFSGADGKIVYLLEANLSRSMRIDKKDSTKINFVSKADPSIGPELMVCDDLHLHSCHSNRERNCTWVGDGRAAEFEFLNSSLPIFPAWIKQCASTPTASRSGFNGFSNPTLLSHVVKTIYYNWNHWHELFCVRGRHIIRWLFLQLLLLVII